MITSVTPLWSFVRLGPFEFDRSPDRQLQTQHGRRYRLLALRYVAPEVEASGPRPAKWPSMADSRRGDREARLLRRGRAVLHSAAGAEPFAGHYACRNCGRERNSGSVQSVL